MQNRRPLAFQCPETNLAVMTPAVTALELAAYPRTVPYMLACPCGQQHIFSIEQGYGWRRKRMGHAGGAASDLRAGAADGV